MGSSYETIICILNQATTSQKGSRFPLNAGIFYASPFAYFPGYHKTDSQFALSRLSLHCLKLGHHISRHNYSQKPQQDKFAVSLCATFMYKQCAVSGDLKN